MHYDGVPRFKLLHAEQCEDCIHADKDGKAFECEEYLVKPGSIIDGKEQCIYKEVMGGD